MSTTAINSQLTLRGDCAGVRMTPDEFDATEQYDELFRYELIDGVLAVKAIPLEAQADPNELLGNLLYVYKTTHPHGTAIDLTLSERYINLPNSRRLADRVIWAGLGRRPNPQAETPTIAVEFVSAGKRSWQRDYVLKHDKYLRSGVVEYWIFDRFERKMSVYRSTSKGSVLREVGEQDVFQTDFLPGFELPLAEFLAAADKWEE